ncbi:PBSX family phage terminase large subunit [Corynebacterium flavescens]|uniref:PBSX family phage terminase large subunit n=1 Tax=Corynebacterium flavescens TaxID=28028 RepID=UPI0031FD8518
MVRTSPVCWIAFSARLRIVAFRLSPGQIEAIRYSTQSLNVWYGSVSSGKTIAWLLMMLGEIKKAGPSGSIVIMGKSLDTIYQNVFEPLLTMPIFATAAPFISYRRRQPVAKIFGRDVLIVGVNDVGAEGRIRGGTYQLVFYDELTLCPESVWDMIWSRMRAVGNPRPPRVMATTNPATPAHWLKRRFIDDPVATDTYSRLFTMEDNPGLTDAYRARTRASYSGVFFRRMIQGQWAAAEGAVYESWDEDVMVTPRDEGTVLAVGVDYGTNHPSAGYALSVVGDRLQITHEWSPQTTGLGGRTRLTDMELADSLQAWLDELPNRPKALYIDPAAASFHEELRRRRIHTVKAANSVVDGIRTVESLLTGGMLTIARECPRLIDEIPGYRWDAKATERGKDAPVKEDDDHCDALRYAVFSSRRLWGKHVEAARLAA